MDTISPQPPATDPPFVIEHIRENETPDGRFVPAARVIILPSLRTGGLLSALTDEATRTLLAVLAFVTPNGHIQPGADQIASVLGITLEDAERRVHRLSLVLWGGQPVLHEIAQPTGRITGVPARQVVASRLAPSQPGDAVTLPLPSHREAIIAHNRATYARPRDEVERIIEEALGVDATEAADTPEGAVRRRLRAVGLSREQVAGLVASHSLDVIERQLDWLPHRRAKDPARFLVAAIEGNYSPPFGLRLKLPLDAMEGGHSGVADADSNSAEE